MDKKIYTRQERDSQLDDIRKSAGVTGERLNSPVAIIYPNGSKEGRCATIIPKGADIWNCSGTLEDNEPGLYYALGSDKRIDVIVENGAITTKEIEPERPSRYVLTELNPKYLHVIGKEGITEVLQSRGINTRMNIEDLLRLGL